MRWQGVNKVSCQVTVGVDVTGTNGVFYGHVGVADTTKTLSTLSVRGCTRDVVGGKNKRFP